MGLHPKIGITGLPRSGKSAVMSKVLDMIVDERVRELRMRGGDPNTLITALPPNVLQRRAPFMPVGIDQRTNIGGCGLSLIHL